MPYEDEELPYVEPDPELLTHAGLKLGLLTDFHTPLLRDGIKRIMRA